MINLDNDKKLWNHQEEARTAFMNAKNGIIEMATGTGKTYTAIRIMKEMLAENTIRRVIVITYGNDLLRQWYYELLLSMDGVSIFRFFERYREDVKFVFSKEKSVLLLSREAGRIAECLSMLEEHDGVEQARKKTLLLFDEVHGFGAPSFIKLLKGTIQKYQFRLGMSATPLRDYDDYGNNFIQTEIGDIIYRFTLEDAIRKGILCPFFYMPIYYELTDRERNRKRKIIASYEIKRKTGTDFDENKLYRDLAKINKTAEKKIPLFESLIIEKPELLERCIIFVETKEYGMELQKMLIHYTSHFHTYYAEDTKDNLSRFGNGQIECLITCKKISEGIDIRSVKNIVLFSSDKGRIVTIQRIGRSLRRNPEDPSKIASVVDFIYKGSSADDITTDQKRMVWLARLAEVRKQDEII